MCASLHRARTNKLDSSFVRFFLHSKFGITLLITSDFARALHAKTAWLALCPRFTIQSRARQWPTEGMRFNAFKSIAGPFYFRYYRFWIWSEESLHPFVSLPFNFFSTHFFRFLLIIHYILQLALLKCSPNGSTQKREAKRANRIIKAKEKQQ